MTPQRWARTKEIFGAALELPDAERSAFLDAACDGDTELRADVERLLEEGDDASLQSPAIGILNAVAEPAPGDTVGPYRIESRLGEGGMGVVYKATDTRLRRSVALKFVKAEFSQRAEREARAVAALNHPHICTLYDVGPNYLVMELVEGETLAARLKRGKLSLDEALRYGGQIADALAAAHAKGIVHRDLKPGNIMVTKAGVKVLDFGLAKIEHLVAEDEHAVTAKGTILGTVQYMSPEQAQGKEADARSDIFSFGLVLYEMISGKRAFEGTSRASVMAAMLERPAPSVAEIAPAMLDRLLHKCLEKDPEERWQSARDLKTNLEWIQLRGGVDHQAKTGSRKLVWGIVGVAIAVIALGGFLWRTFNSPEASGVPAHFILAPPAGTRFAMRLPNKPLVAVAPDGEKLVLVAQDDAGVRSLWLRPLDSTVYHHLDRTEGASLAFWSPDSQFIAFFADGKIKKIPVTGGSPLTICEAGVGDGEGGTWSPNGVILFPAPRKDATAFPKGALNRVPASGGTLQRATALNTGEGEVSHSWPQFLPDGRHFLYLARNEKPEKSRIYVQELDSVSRRILLNSNTLATYANGPNGRPYLLFPRDRALLAQPLNLSSFQLFGEPVTVASDVSYNTMYGTSAFSVSTNGVLAYRSGTFGASGTPTRQLAWYNREGDRLGDVGIAGAYGSIALSPDDTKVAIQRKVKLDDLNDWDIWILDLEPGIFSRLTHGPSFSYPVWSPDTRKLATVSTVGNRREVVEVTLASGVTKVLFFDQEPKQLETWTPDGRSLLFITFNPSAMPGAFRLSIADGKAEPILVSDFYKGRFKVSPDGHWIAYHSTETGKREIHVRSFPALDQDRQISNGTGSQPLWRADGKELYYLTLDAKLMAVDIKAGASLGIGKPKLLFQTTADGNPDLGQYSVTADGQKFLIMETARAGAGPAIEQFHIQLNWFSALMNNSGRLPWRTTQQSKWASSRANHPSQRTPSRCAATREDVR